MSSCIVKKCTSDIKVFLLHSAIMTVFVTEEPKVEFKEGRFGPTLQWIKILSPFLHVASQFTEHQGNAWSRSLRLFKHLSNFLLRLLKHKDMVMGKIFDGFI